MSNKGPNKKLIKRLNSLLPAWATYELELGSRHWRIKVGDRLVGILPKGGTYTESDDRALKNTASQIVRAHKGLDP